MKNWSAFLVCLLLSFSVWLIHNLSHVHTETVNVEVVALSNIEGRSERSSDAVTIAARCRSTGYGLVKLTTRRRAVEVRFDSADFEWMGGDFYTVTSDRLNKYVPRIFGSGVTVESFISSEVLFRFQKQNYRKVPVKGVKLISFVPQYMALSPMTFSPDSVTVYGSPEMIGGIDAIYTKNIVRNDVRSGIHGIARLEAPAGVRLSEKEVSYEMGVTRYVELRSSSPVLAKGVPHGVELLVFPSTVEVTFKCVFPLIENPVGKVSFYVDYSDFSSSLTGKCVIRHDKAPQGVLEISVDPEVAECVEKLQ